MGVQDLHLPATHQRVVNRFIAACQADDRVIAAFLSGAYARGAADAYSDLDLGLITTDATYDEFFASHAAFIQQIGSPIFRETYHGSGSDMLFFTFPDGVETEVALGRASHFTHISSGPYIILVDKPGILTNAVFTGYIPTQAEQTATLQNLISWFWHDLSHHFLTAIARGRLWSAHGHLEELRLTCVNLLRLTHDFTTEPEGYEKLEQAVPTEQLAPLRATYCPLDRDAMLQAARIIVRLYRDLALPLAQSHGISYPTALDHMMSARLDTLLPA
ncbi:MAG: hypothetical protein OJF49_002468 [Ktedonobacterales bacterium]|jgi:hypothetical protein|nr:MAG: hypothetical protein OJF49_002468 [Ktedonobacterales bacterium]